MTRFFFEKYPVLIDPSLCWDFFWKSILVCGVRTSTEGHALHGVRFLTPNRRQRTRRQKLELLQWIVALRWGGWDVSPEKRTISKGKANVFLHQPFSAKMLGFFGRLCHWNAIFVEIKQCTSEITCEHSWDWLDDKHGCPVSRTTQRFAEPCSWAYCNRLGQMVEDGEKKETSNECIIQRLTVQADPEKISPRILWIYSHGKDVDTSNQFKMCRYIGNQFYVCTSGSVGFHSGLDFPKVWILAHDALHPQGGTLKISETAKFWSQLSVSLGILKHPWFVLFFLVLIHFFAQNSWILVGGGDDREGSTNLLVSSCAKFRGWLRLYQNLRENFERPRSQMLLAAHSSPQPRPGNGGFVLTYPPWVKAWLHLTWINRDGICGAVLEAFGLWTADSLGCFRMFRWPGSQQMDLVVANTIDSGANLLWFASP